MSRLLPREVLEFFEEQDRKDSASFGQRSLESMAPKKRIALAEAGRLARIELANPKAGIK